MKTLPRSQTEPLWDKYWSELREEWFKLEVLQDYSPEDTGKSLNMWLKGDKQASIQLMKADPAPLFTKMCQEKIKDGVILNRVHIVEEPLTTYLEWEIEFYSNVSVPLRGEQVFNY